MADKPDGVTIATITIDLIAADTDVHDMGLQVWIECDGDPPMIQALGMLELARDTVLKWPENGDGDD